MLAFRETLRICQMDDLFVNMILAEHPTDH